MTPAVRRGPAEIENVIVKKTKNSYFIDKVKKTLLLKIDSIYAGWKNRYSNWVYVVLFDRHSNTEARHRVKVRFRAFLYKK